MRISSALKIKYGQEDADKEQLNYVPEQDDDIKVLGTVVVFRIKEQIEVLIESHKAGFVLPQGHLKDGETPAQGTARELEEETHVKVSPETLIPIVRREVQKKKINHVFAVQVPPDTEARADSDADEVFWCTLDKVPRLAFNHENLILQALVKLYKINKVTHGVFGIKTAKLFDFKHIPEAGTLIVFEGCDGAGKSFCSTKLEKYLKNEDYDVEKTKWNSSDMFTKAIDKAKEERVMTPLIYSLAHMLDMVYRYENFIIPKLDNNEIVICDRYMYTSMVRDSIRGVDMEVPKSVYKYFRQPDILFHCTAPDDVLLKRIKGEKGLSYYGSGQDMELSKDKEENCKMYQKMTGDVYKDILPKMCKNYYELNTDRDPSEVLDDIISKVTPVLGE